MHLEMSKTTFMVVMIIRHVNVFLSILISFYDSSIEIH